MDKFLKSIFFLYLFTTLTACNSKQSESKKNQPAQPEITDTAAIDSTAFQDSTKIKVTQKTKEKEDNKTYSITEEMPYFPGCSDNECSKKEIKKFIEEHLKYPALAKEKGTEGVVLLSFIVQKNGTVQSIKILKDIGDGCGEEAVKVVQLMTEKKIIWTPGKKKGKPVKVKYHLPVRFKLPTDSR